MILLFSSVVLQIPIWDLLSIFATVITPILVLILTAFGHMLWWYHKRLSNLEQGQTQLSRTIYGDQRDSRASGLSQEISEIKSQIDQIDDVLSDIERREEIRQIHDDDDKK